MSLAGGWSTRTTKTTANCRVGNLGLRRNTASGFDRCSGVARGAYLAALRNKNAPMAATLL
eukprot:8715408-Lingulodinium_polyedra.AAC.1